MLEQENQQHKAAANLLNQFADAGLVQQEDDGFFSVQGDNTGSKFKPFGNE